MKAENMTQVAPFPGILLALVTRTRYRPGWRVRLANMDRGQGSEGMTLVITTLGYDSYHPDRGENYRVNHYMPVPPAAYDERSWQRWLFEQFLLVERHECMEFFAIDAGRKDVEPPVELLVRPYAPSHGPGNDPYLVREVGTELDRRTSFKGDVATKI